MGLLGKAKKAVGSLTGKNQAKAASKKQTALNERALGELDAFASDKYDNNQRDIVNRLTSGKAANLDQSAYASTTATPLNALRAAANPALAKAMGGSLGGTASKALSDKSAQDIENLNNETYVNAQNMAEGMQGSALTNLQNASANRANIYNGMAAQVQATPSPLSQINGTLNTVKNVAGAKSAASG
jgi:hypothetical protein